MGSDGCGWTRPTGTRMAARIAASRRTNYAYRDRRTRVPPLAAGPLARRPAPRDIAASRSGDDRAEVPRTQQAGLHPAVTVRQGQGQPAVAGPGDAGIAHRRPGLDRDLLRQPAGPP